ncbi:aldehyde dehydrogenase [Rhizoctonia solani AG-1 IA]|uniref:Aldehyde dehydrogenase n=1 Tax=Thanatephorus cucumeris (strain AG1-IA) TaxID=983506 RepID=L8WW56_THACA|nr:aldehyde dehydrogenase [Rhizoctonia solani AG-1 IA]
MAGGGSQPYKTWLEPAPLSQKHPTSYPKQHTMSHYTHIINGKPASSSSTLGVQNPATQRKIAEVPVATKDQLDEAVAAARAALPAWSAKSQDERAQVLEQIAGIIQKNISEYKYILVSEQGKTVSKLNDAEMEIGAAVVMLLETANKDYRASGTDWSGGFHVLLIICVGLMWFYTISVQVSPHGEHIPYISLLYCITIFPRNFPVVLSVTKIGPALLAGNTFVLKPSPFTPLTTLRLMKDIQKVVPPGVINVLSGDDNLGPWITAHPGIDKVSFTGSSDTGKRVMASASIGLKRLTLELGGNDPAIILPDVDVAKIVPEMFWAALIVSSLLYIVEYELFTPLTEQWADLDELAKFAKTVKTGDGTDPESQLGPVQNLMQYKKVLSFFEDAKANGYKFVTGGDVNPNPTDGLFIPASFVDNPPEDSKIVREEPFGPIVPLLKWSDEADVIKRASECNDTNMGLAASVWGKDLAAVQRIAKQIEAGVVCMNERNPVTPFSSFGGHKESGIGVENGLSGLLSYSNIQTLTLKKQPAFV